MNKGSEAILTEKKIIFRCIMYIQNDANPIDQ